MRPTIAILLLWVAAWWGPSAALAQPPPVPQATVITLRPALQPVPALKYRLVPERITLVSGNAAIFYHRAILLLTQVRSRLAADEKARPGANPDRVTEQTLFEWSTRPISEFPPRNKVRPHLDAYQDVLREIELGASRLTCDWEFDDRNDGIFFQIPEIQEMRSLARLVVSRSRLAILDGETDEAMHWIEVGLVMGRHASQGPVAVQTLVGVAIDMLMIRCLEDLIQTPGAPNLFWALADRPRPFIDMRSAMAGERYLLEKELPRLKDLDDGPWSLDQARRFADELQRKLYTIADGRPIATGTGTTDLAGLSRRLGIAAMAAKIYPEAKHALIAQGRREMEVEAMPITQVAALFSLREYQRTRDESYKWINIPYWQSHDRMDRANRVTAEEKLVNPMLAFFQMLIPNLNGVRLSAIRLDRQLDALQCIEAIRMYAALHQGKPPTNLTEMTDAPAPIDLVTGKAFVYERNGDSATLSAPMPPGFNHAAYAIRYELKLAR